MTVNVSFDELESMRRGAGRLRHNHIISSSVYVNIVRKIDKLAEELEIRNLSEYPTLEVK